ncbi:metallophosphoesterase [bacterium]|nr:metallophosphoesterase [bacterium]
MTSRREEDLLRPRFFCAGRRKRATLMLLGIVSDSHDHLTRLEWALDRCIRENIEGLIHPGDIIAPFAARMLAQMWTGPRLTVYGNNDGERRGLALVLPEITDGPVLCEWGGKRISVDHYPPDAEHRPITKASLVIFGHTHQVLVERREGVLYLNPGESCGWVTGRPTMALLDTENERVEIIEIEV